MTQELKAWYLSKTKWAGILTGVGLIVPGIVSWLNGGSVPIHEIWLGAATILTVFGIRDLPILNRK